MKGNPRFTKLLEPCRIRQLNLKNRIVMAAMGTNFATADGYITQRIKDFYEERAKGGVGTIVLETGCVDLAGKLMTHQVCLYDDGFIPGLRELAETLQRHGTKVLMQLHHGGRYCYPERTGGHHPVAPSAISMPGRLTPKELTAPEIAQIVERFAQGAERAKKAGLDGVEIHAGHGYLIAQFLSGNSNKRQDAYGGELKNRARMLLETIKAVREKVGDGYPVWCRIDGREFGLEGGITPEDGRELARMIEAAGVDAINVSGYGGVTNFHFVEAPLTHTPGKLVPFAEGIKRVVKIPVIAVGRISPDLGEEILRQGKADLIAMARPLLADPEFPSKLASGRQDDIKPCIYCYTCIHKIFLSQSMSCAVNPAAGKEGELKLEPAEKTRKITIVGGGPAGLETARIAALRGHQVTLYEKDRRLGGSLFFASVLTKENEDLLNWLVKQARKLGVNIKLGKEVKPESIQGMNPEATILAVGPSLAMPQIAGADQRHVISGPELRQIMSGHLGKDTARKLAWWERTLLRLANPMLRRFLTPYDIRWLTRYWMPIGKKVAIVGGDFVACELAEFLAHRGRKVTIVGSGTDLAVELSIPGRWKLMNSLSESGVTMITAAKCQEITREGVVINTKDGERRTVEADTVLFAEGIEPNPKLFQAIEGKVSPIYRAGDCKGLGLIEGAMADAATIASKI